MNNERISVALDGMLLGGEFSGVEHAILGLAVSLAESGRHGYRFFIPASCRYPDPAGPGFETVRVNIPRSRPARIMWEQARLPALVNRGRFDLLHAPGYLAPLGAKVPVVLTVYDMQALRFPELCLPLNRLNYRILLPMSIRMARGVIAPSNPVAREIADLFPDAAGKVRVIPIGLNPVFRVIGPDGCAAVTAKFGISGPFILFAGSMMPKKNIPALVSAFGMAKRGHSLPHKLVLAGRKAGEYRAVCRRIREEGLEREVLFTGYVEDGELACLYNAADVFVFPSLYEGFGLPPLEAMACGTPVICSAEGGLAETAAPAALTVDPRDVYGMAGAIVELTKDRVLHAGLKQKGLGHAVRFTREKTMAETESFYAEAAACLNV